MADHLWSLLNDFIVNIILYIGVICVFTKMGICSYSFKTKWGRGAPRDFYISNYCGRQVDYQKLDWTNLNTTYHDTTMV